MVDGDGSSSKSDPSSPFYLGTQDRPGDYITSERLKLDNFDAWSHDIRVALKSRRKFGFLDGSIKAPTPPYTKEDWEAVHCMLVSWIRNTIHPEVKSLLSKYDDAKRLWDDLHERFSVVSGSRIYQLKSDVHECNQTFDKTVAVYFGTLNMLWDDLDKHEPLISCKCGKCECNVGKQHMVRRESDRLHQFLYGLQPDVFNSVRTVLLSQDTLPTLNRAFQTISQEERARGIDRSKDSSGSLETAAFAVRSTPRSTSSVTGPRLQPYLSKAEKRALRCTHCNKQGHDVSMCFDLLAEKPEWWYELKGKKPPVKGGRGVGTAGRSSTSRDAVTNSVTVYGTPSHDFMGPTNESGDWNG